MLPLRAKAEMGVMVINVTVKFPKTPAFLERHQQIIECHIRDTPSSDSYPSTEKQSVYPITPADWIAQAGGTYKEIDDPVDRLAPNRLRRLYISRKDVEFFLLLPICIIGFDWCNVMANVFWFMPLSLVRLRTFRLSTWVS